MLSNSSIQNQNVINSNNISGSSSGSLLCNSLTLTDGNNTTNLGPTNTTLNSLTVNGVSNFNETETHNNPVNFKNNVNLSTFNFAITNAAGNQELRIFNNVSNKWSYTIYGNRNISK